MKHIKDLIKRILYTNLKTGYVLLMFVAMCVGLLCLVISDIKRHDFAHVITDGIMLYSVICVAKDVL